MPATKDRRGTNKMLERIRRIQKCDQGATAAEYGLIASLIAVAAMGVMGTMGNKLSNTFTNVGNNIK